MAAVEDETPPAITGSVLLNGGDGNDTISGYRLQEAWLDFDVSGRLSLYGGAGNDSLRASWYDPNYDGSPVAIDSTDWLYRGRGDDNYWVFEARDHVIEKAGEGYDTVDAFQLDYMLPVNVEKLVMEYSPANYPLTGYRGVGNAADNVIVGSDLGERLEGAAMTRSTVA